ncbi:MAG: hypothetical protein NWP79_12355, partial [Paracoccaceae bacterium]|nr:hypothetical protein [Paracoccaceae bacterium]
CKPLRQGGNKGVEFHRYYVGAQLSIDEHGELELPGCDPNDPITYKYQIMPLAQMYGRRISSVWGLDGKPGSWWEREDSSTRALIRQLLRNHKALITVEQGAKGGFGAMVLHDLANDGLLDGRCQVRTMTLPDRYIDHAAPDAMYADAGLTAVDIAATAMQAAGIEVKRVEVGV